jgi:hypothetical protein
MRRATGTWSKIELAVTATFSIAAIVASVYGAPAMISIGLTATCVYRKLGVAVMKSAQDGT